MQLCDSYEEGLCRLNAEPFDFIIVDQGSPHFEGRLVLERSIEENPHLPVLVVARCHSMATHLEAMQLGAVDCLAEPVAPSDFLWVAGAHLRSRNARA
jgi:DNA-binding response OmpR family regulator